MDVCSWVFVFSVLSNNNNNDTKLIKCHNAVRRLQRRWRNRQSI